MSQVWRVSVGKMPDRQKMGRQTLGSTFQIRMAPSTESAIYKWFSTLKELAPKHFDNEATSQSSLHRNSIKETF